MGRGPGWLERAILDLLGILTSTYLHRYSPPRLILPTRPMHPIPPPDEAIDPTPAQRAAVRRAFKQTAEARTGGETRQQVSRRTLLLTPTASTP